MPSMKLAFSTLACPAWSVEQVVGFALQFGYDGVEWRLIDGDTLDPRLHRVAITTAVALGRARGVETCAFDTSCCLNQATAEDLESMLDELSAWISLAQDLRVPFLRVFGGANPEGEVPDDSRTDARVLNALRRVLPLAERCGVAVLLETHDTYSSARRVADVLNHLDSPSVAAIWDSHHPYRVGETAAQVLGYLGPRVAHVHVKDARRTGEVDDWQLVLMGEGEVPVRDQLAVLHGAQYSGWISVEWEKKWHPELAEPEIALPQHIAWLKETLTSL